MVTLRDVAAMIAELPGVSVGTRWNNRTWLVGPAGKPKKQKGFVWERPLSKADIARFGDARVPRGDILGVITENLDAKDALLAMELPGFFTIEHFRGYAAVLVELAKARKRDVRAAIRDAHRVATVRS